VTVDCVIIDKGREEPGRESPQRKQYLYKFGVPFIEQRLEIGDYLVGDYPIEYKSWEDFYASMMDGRLFEQAKNLCQYKRPMIAVVGDRYKALYNMNKYRKGGGGGNIRRGSPDVTIRNGLVTLYKSFPISVMMFDSDKDFCLFVKGLFDSLNKEKRHYRPIFHKRKPKTLKEVKENVMAESRGGISIGKAKILLGAKDYSIRQVINNIDSLKNVKGIGPKIVDRLKEVFD